MTDCNSHLLLSVIIKMCKINLFHYSCVKKKHIVKTGKAKIVKRIPSIKKILLGDSFKEKLSK